MGKQKKSRDGRKGRYISPQYANHLMVQKLLKQRAWMIWFYERLMKGVLPKEEVNLSDIIRLPNQSSRDSNQMLKEELSLPTSSEEPSLPNSTVPTIPV
jgi:hypothetical protein